MTADWPVWLALFALGGCGGFLAGLLGVGGGMILVPFIIALLAHRGVPDAMAVKMAIATSMAMILFTSMSSLRSHHRSGAIRWDVWRRLAPGILVGGLVGGAGVFNVVKGNGLALFFAVFVGLSATQMLLDRKPKPTRQLPGTLGLFSVGGGIGLLSGLVGAGGAFMSVPFMTWCNLGIHAAVATSAALGFPIALANTLGYVVGGWSLPPALPGAFGYLYLPALLALSTASVLMAPVGARLTHRMDVRPLRRTFAVLLYGVAGYMLYRGLTGTG